MSPNCQKAKAQESKMTTFIQSMGNIGGRRSQSIISINGSRIVSSVIGTGGSGNLPEASFIKVIALDKDKKQLDSYTMPAKGNPKVVITAESIDRIDSESGDLKVKKCGNITSIKTASGDFEIEDCGDIGRIHTISGDVKIQRAGKVGNISSVSGDAKVTSLKRKTEGKTSKAKKRKAVPK